MGWLIRAFPHKFPWGRGGPCEPRPVKLSRNRLFEYYARVSSGAFLGYDYVLHVYDIIARASLSSRTYLTASFKPYVPSTEPDRASNLSQVSVADMKAAAAYHKALSESRRLGHVPPPKPSGATLLGCQFHNSVAAVCRFAEHTSEHAGDARVKSYNMHYRFGKPTWWYVSRFLVNVPLRVDRCSCIFYSQDNDFARRRV